MRPRHALLLAGHVIAGLVVIVAVASHRIDRQAAADDLVSQAERERKVTQDLQQQVAVQKALLAGIRADDPYTIELLARQELGMRGGANEIHAPPLETAPVAPIEP